MPIFDPKLGGDAKRVALATSSSIPQKLQNSSSSQPTLDGVFNRQPRRHSSTHTRKHRKIITRHSPPVAFFTYPAEPRTPPRPTQRAEPVLSPASHFRTSILSHSTDPNGATIYAGTVGSPRLLKEAGNSSFLGRTIDLRIQGEDEEKENGRVLFFGHTLSTENYEALPRSETIWEDEKFKLFQRRKRLTSEASNTTKTLKITLKSIEDNEGIPRSVTQDSIMRHTANSHMRDRLDPPTGKKIEYCWGHRFAHTLNAIPPTPKDLEVVGPAANTYESVMTAGLKQAIKHLSHIKPLGHWELTVTSYHMKVLNNKTGKIAYLPHVSHKQEYTYVYVDETGKHSKPLVFVINPLDPNEVSYQESTKIFQDIFSAVMQKESFFRSKQRKLNFQPKEAVVDSGFMNSQSEEAPPAAAIPKQTTSEKMDISAASKPSLAKQPSADQRQQERKRKTDMDYAYEVTPFLKMHPDTLISLVAKQAIISNGFILSTPENDKEYSTTELPEGFIEESLRRPIIFINPNNYPYLSPDFDQDIGDPTFVFEKGPRNSKENDGKDDILILPQGSCPPEILAAIEEAQQAFKKRRTSRENRQKKSAPHELPSITKDIRQAISNEVLSGLEFQSIKGDGHCFYTAAGLYLGKDFKELRENVADYMQAHMEYFLEFWSDDEESLIAHIQRVRFDQREWADHFEIEALQRLTGRPIIIIKPNANPTIPDNLTDYTKPPIFVFYNNRYGRGDAHYEALTVKDGYTPERILETLLHSIKAGCLVTHPGKPTTKKPQPNLMAFFTRDSGAAASGAGASVETPSNLMAMMSGCPEESTISQRKNLFK